MVSCQLTCDLFFYHPIICKTVDQLDNTSWHVLCFKKVASSLIGRLKRWTLTWPKMGYCYILQLCQNKYNTNLVLIRLQFNKLLSKRCFIIAAFIVSIPCIKDQSWNKMTCYKSFSRLVLEMCTLLLPFRRL